ncbi:MAG: hypothetical protein ACYDH9_06240 [Limisphaerales bacterium]
MNLSGSRTLSVSGPRLAASAGQPFHPSIGAGAGPGGFRADRALHWARWLGVLGVSVSLAISVRGAQTVDVGFDRQAVRLGVGEQTWRFTQSGGTWALDAVVVRGVDVARPLRREDSVFVGGGTAPGFSVLRDRDLGGRISDVCEKHYADAVDTLVDVAAVPLNYDPEKCLQVMPVRLAAPDAFIPGWGWMMDEFPNASYPFAHDAVWQEPALLAFEGLATRRDWERNFARYLLDKTPLAGPDGKSYFVRRPGGLTRWGYFATYGDGFPPLDGGTWWTADMLYHTALALDDSELRRAAVEMVRHDLDVKLDLDHMSYPPCWSAEQNRIGDDHRDDWFKTPGLAYCAYVASKIAYPETKDPAYLAKADRICDWFAGYLADESKLNFLQGNNVHATFSFYLALAFLDRCDRSHDRRFLAMFQATPTRDADVEVNPRLSFPRQIDL